MRKFIIEFKVNILSKCNWVNKHKVKASSIEDAIKKTKEYLRDEIKGKLNVELHDQCVCYIRQSTSAPDSEPP